MISKYDKTKCTSKYLQGYSGCCCNYCRAYSQLGGKWIVDIKGSWMHGEISVIRESFRHGFASWGWFEKNRKIMVYSDSHRWGTPYEVFKAHIETAKKLAKQLNKDDNNRS